MCRKGNVFSLNISPHKGTVKYSVESISIDSKGVVGDAHYGDSNRHVSIVANERINEFADEICRDIKPGEFAENITTSGLDYSGISISDSIRIGTVELTVVQLGKDEADIDTESSKIIGKPVMCHEGIFCSVIKGGSVTKGDTVEFIPAGTDMDR